MAASKRKQASSVPLDDGRNFKKSKVNGGGTTNSAKHEEELEAETDSDPIVESDTNSQSGDDDGADWPSDAEDKEWDGGIEEDDNNGAGTEKPSKAARADQSVKDSTLADPKNSCMQPRFFLIQMLIML